MDGAHRRRAQHKNERMEVIELLYGAAAPSKKRPTKTVQVELDAPHGTASDWIGSDRAAGRLDGKSYTRGRPRVTDLYDPVRSWGANGTTLIASSTPRPKLLTG